MSHFARLALLLILISGPCAAQTLPTLDNLFVTDEAGILPEEAEAELRAQLESLKEETGVEMTVATLKSKRNFAPDMTLEAFATELFNHWGIGAENRDDGILVLVLRQDRTMRVELGKGYGADWQLKANEVVERSFVPAFKTYDYAGGIRAGVTDLIETVAIPRSKPPASVAGEGSSGNSALGLLAWLGGGLAAIVGGVMVIGRVRTRMRKCASCGKGGVTAAREVVAASTESQEGQGRLTLTCPHCGHATVSSYSIAKRTPAKKNEEPAQPRHGGGESEGGGATGRW